MIPNLKIVVTAVLLQLYAVTALHSQQCTNDSLLNYPSRDVSYTNPGFIDPNLLPCIPSGSYTELVIPFNTYNQGARLLMMNDSSTVAVPQIYSIQVASITNLPSGLCWFMWPSSGSITGTKTGVLVIKGATTVAGGTYPLNVSLNLDTQGSGTFNYSSMLPFNYKALLGQVVLKVQDASTPCPIVTY
jgi:hypothetical protein